MPVMATQGSSSNLGGRALHALLRALSLAAAANHGTLPVVRSVPPSPFIESESSSSESPLKRAQPSTWP